MISRAHAAGCKVLLCVGGAGTQSGFKQATTPEHLSGFISNLVTLVKSRGYDGIDVDWEPLETVDTLPFQKFIKGLRTALEKSIPHSLLTAAVANEPALVAGVQSQFDQVNVMTYDQAGPWDGWVTWFNAPLYDGGYRFASSGGLINSADGLSNQSDGHGGNLAGERYLLFLPGRALLSDSHPVSLRITSGFTASVRARHRRCGFSTESRSAESSSRSFTSLQRTASCKARLRRVEKAMASIEI